MKKKKTKLERAIAAVKSLRANMYYIRNIASNSLKEDIDTEYSINDIIRICTWCIDRLPEEFKLKEDVED